MDHFIEEELKMIVSEGAFGKNCSLVSFKLYNSMTGIDEWWYRRIFCYIITSDGSHYNIMIKLKIQDLALQCRGPTVNDAPALFLPNFFYGRNKCSELIENDLIVIENVNALGYCLSNEKVFLDYEHLTVALQTIAKFHGLSYTAKHVKDLSAIHEIVENVHKVQIESNDQWMAQSEFIKKCGKRGLGRLLERDADKYRDHVHIRLMNELLGDADKTFIQTLEAREPLSVVCQGDYLRYTLLFLYDEHGHPSDATSVDFGTVHYGSPALDLSSFLYMSTTQQMREAHWDDLLDAYCAALANAVQPGVRVPDRAEIDAEMAATAVNGFAKASFTLPFMLHDRSDSLDSLATSDDPADYFLALGGDVATECLADMVQHFVDMGYPDVRRDLVHSNPVENPNSLHCQSSKELS
ncbi:uncharacterized protein LOC111038226 isoform X2 [Myzus persicae]|uniref:uncharacterized protein LOC111038226 isoform X2 n=1 Tax=Myzus persicae TaxID=13164 RepID=UPI000B9381BA|nr:uncharacterized protein LOC111038226 isoform X2 [Myzus persicae]